MTKKLLVAFTVIFALFVGQAAFAAVDMPFEADCGAAVLIEASTGQILMGKNIDEQLNLAGASKILAAHIITQAIDNGELDLQRSVNVSDAAASAGGMSAFLTKNGEYKVEDLYKAMMMISANDATTALAETLYGSADAFVAKMRETARDLNINPVIENMTGHNAQNQKMSVLEAAAIARELLRSGYPTKYAAIYMDELTHSGARKTEMVNPNRLVRYYNGCDGLMTGSSKSAGYNGVFTAKRGDTRFVAVVAGAKNSNTRSTIAQNMFDYAFANYKSTRVVKAGEVLADKIEVKNGIMKSVQGVAEADVAMVAKKEDIKNIKKEIVLNEAIEAPIAKGDKLGELRITAGSDVVVVPIVASEEVPESSFKRSLNAIARMWIYAP